MTLVEGNCISLCKRKVRVGSRDEGLADGDLSSETNDRASYVSSAESGDTAVDVAWVRREKRAEDENDFAGTMRRGMARRISGYSSGI